MQIRYFVRKRPSYIDLFSRYFRGGIFSKNWREVAVAMLLNMLRRVKRDAGLASAFTRMCRPRRHLPSWCLRSLMSVWRQLRGTFYSTQNSGFRLFSVKEDNLLRYNQIFENLFPGTFRSIWFSCWNFRIFRSNGSGFRKFDNFQIFWNLSLEISAPLVPVLENFGIFVWWGRWVGV